MGVLIGCLGPALIIYVWAQDLAQLRHRGTVAVRLLGTLAGLAIATAGYTFPVMRYIDRSFASEGQATKTQLNATRSWDACSWGHA